MADPVEKESKPLLVRRDAAGRLLPGTAGLPGAGRSPVTWKASLRTLVGPNGERAMQTLVDILDGKAWVPILPDGRQGPAQIPDTTNRREAAVYVLNLLNGKPVAQTEIVQAELQASAAEAIKALSDEELAKRARQALIAASSDAETVQGVLPATLDKEDQ